MVASHQTSWSSFRVLNSLKAIGRAAVSYPPLGAIAACALGWLGRHERRSRVLQLSGHHPSVVKVCIPNRLRSHSKLRLSSVRGTDPVAMRLWMYGWAGFEPPMLDLFALHAAQARTVFDIGANSGLYAILAAIVAPQAQVYAFEPLPEALEVLRRNIALNGLAHRIHVIESAVADNSGHADFYVPTSEAGLLEGSASLNPAFRPSHSKVLRVPVTTVDEFVTQRGIERIDLMKIDVESQEHRVLAGAGTVLAHHRPVVFLEVLPSGALDQLELLRQSLGYKAFHAQSDGVFAGDRVVASAALPNQVLVPNERCTQFAQLCRPPVA